jgi:hypothetical protein
VVQPPLDESLAAGNSWPTATAKFGCDDCSPSDQAIQASPPSPLWRYFHPGKALRPHGHKSTNTCITGLIVQFFKVGTPNGQSGTGSSRGKILGGGSFAPNLRHRGNNALSQRQIAAGHRVAIWYAK